jgi:hypothetical protein
MSLWLAFDNQSQDCTNFDERQHRVNLMLARLHRPSMNNRSIKIGQRVTYLNEPGTVIAVNISNYGRWPGHLYPYVVHLDCGLTTRCSNLDLLTQD